MMNMGNETVRADFLTGNDGAAVLTQEELNFLDELYPLLSPKREEGAVFAQQVSATFVNGFNRMLMWVMTTGGNCG
jgi:hypothetical protein